MTSSSKRSELNLARGVPTSDEDVAALRQVRAGRQLSTENYLRALASLEPPPLEVLRARKRARGGEAFRLASGVPRTIR
jgi:hypothetical protein